MGKLTDGREQHEEYGEHVWRFTAVEVVEAFHPGAVLHVTLERIELDLLWTLIACN